MACSLLSACGGRSAPDAPDALDGVSLLDLWAGAETDWQVRSINFGSTARRHFVEGWGSDDSGRLRDAVWALGTRSTLRFFVAKPRDVELYIDARRRQFGPSAAAPVTVSVNGQVVGSVIFAGRFGEPRRLATPASVWKRGVNFVTFDHVTAEAPSQHSDSKDLRPLASSFNALALRGLARSDAPEIRQGTTRQASEIFLPFGSQAAFYLEPQAAGELVIRTVEASSSLAPKGRLVVLVESGDGKTRRTDRHRFGQGSTDVRVSLEPPGEVIRLTLRSEALDGRGDSRGLTLVDPRIVSNDSDVVGAASGGRPEPVSGAKRNSPKRTDKPDILLYVVDTLRADHVGSYGHLGGTTPNLDALAADSILFERARAQSSWTRPTMASVFTGLYPQQHRAEGALDALADELETLPQVLSDEGYATAAVITNGVVSQKFGFGRGFDAFEYLPEDLERKEIHHRAGEVTDWALDWLRSRKEAAVDPPFFLYLHVTDPHAPYSPPEPWRRRFAADVDPSIGLHQEVEALDAAGPVAASRVEGLKKLYDAEIAYTDSEFGRLVEALKDMSLYEELVVIVLADHGEEFGEHGLWQHGQTLYEEQLQIPLWLKLPGGVRGGSRERRVVEQIDVWPTILELVGHDGGSFSKTRFGASLLPSEDPVAVRQDSFARLNKNPARIKESVLLESAKLIHHRTSVRPHRVLELFDLSSDPGELRSRGDGDSILAGYLRARLRMSTIRWRPATSGQTVVDEELEQSLRALGYIE